MWGCVTSGEKDRDPALVSIMAEWSSSNGFAPRLSSLPATLEADESPAGATDLSASDWLFSCGGDKWGELSNDEGG